VLFFEQLEGHWYCKKTVPVIAKDCFFGSGPAYSITIERKLEMWADVQRDEIRRGKKERKRAAITKAETVMQYDYSFLKQLLHPNVITVYVFVSQVLLNHPHNVECVSPFSDVTRQQWNRVIAIIKKTHAKVFNLSRKFM